MKKEIILLLIAITIIIGLVLPKPLSTVISLVILIPTAIYLIIDIIKNGNQWKSE